MSMRDSIVAARLNGPLEQADRTISFEFRFRGSDPTFAGHFPGRPVLPGVFQLEMARLSAEWVLQCPLALLEVTKAKFLRPIVPEETVRLDLKLSEQENTIRAHARFSVSGKSAGETLLLLWRND